MMHKPSWIKASLRLHSFVRIQRFWRRYKSWRLFRNTTTKRKAKKD